MPAAPGAAVAEMTSLIDHSIKFSLVSLQISNSKCDQSSNSVPVGRNTNRSPDPINQINSLKPAPSSWAEKTIEQHANKL